MYIYIYIFCDASTRFRPMVSSHGASQSYSLDSTVGRTVLSPTQRPLPDNTQHSKETAVSLVGFELTVPRLRARGHWDRLKSVLYF